MVIRNEVRISKSPDLVWKFLSDSSNTGRWQTGFCSREQVSGNPGFPGAEAIWHYEEGGRTVTVKEKVVKTAPPSLYHGLFEHELITVEMHTQIEKLDKEESQVSCVLQIRFNSPSVETLAPYMHNVFFGRQERDLQSLKKVLESAS